MYKTDNKLNNVIDLINASSYSNRIHGDNIEILAGWLVDSLDVDLNTLSIDEILLNLTQYTAEEYRAEAEKHEGLSGKVIYQDEKKVLILE